MKSSYASQSSCQLTVTEKSNVVALFNLNTLDDEEFFSKGRGRTDYSDMGIQPGVPSWDRLGLQDRKSQAMLCTHQSKGQILEENRGRNEGQDLPTQDCRRASLDIASVCFSAFSIVALAGFFYMEKSKGKASQQKRDYQQGVSNPDVKLQKSVICILLALFQYCCQTSVQGGTAERDDKRTAPTSLCMRMVVVIPPSKVHGSAFRTAVSCQDLVAGVLYFLCWQRESTVRQLYFMS
ncbi:hypothetical protein L6452_07254 [Arctium lappa]|uniref:Uncharacterized protein n=1 Tax=Arctium lappa TaxID=4217 RepID=A0ACB9EKU9_ARCLA|nr:hypothetical protein L6452_07254 [Arctium lappa]